MAGFADVTIDPGMAKGLQRGDRKAQAAVFTRLAPVVMGLALRILRDDDQAKEVVQDTFVRVLEHADELENLSALVGWVRKVAVNNCLMRIRSPWYQRRVWVDMETVQEDNGGPVRDVPGTVHDLEQALASLPPETRMVIWLHDVEGYTHREIGELMEKTTSYSKSQLARGYERLSATYSEHSDAIEKTDIRSACT